MATPDLDARLLVCAACGIDHGGLIRDPDVPLGAAAAALRAFAARRLLREPVSRILGAREFWGLPLAIDRSVLDPRADTEVLVRAVLDGLGGRRGAALGVLDLGTGSGAILCALLHELPGACGLGVDRSLPACRAARRNLQRLDLGKRARVVCGCWGDALAAPFDVVVANPPYIRSGDIAGLEPDVRDHDPVAALDGGLDGLDAYRAIVPRLRALLAPGGLAALECGWDQGGAVAGMMETTGLTGVAIHLDLAGHSRVVTGSVAGDADRA